MPLLRVELQQLKWQWPGPLIHDISQVLHLPFDYDDGSYARDRSGYKNDGTIYGATRTAGKIGQALSLDGVDDHVEVADSPSLRITDEITIKVWIHPKPGGVATQHIVSKLDSATSTGYVLSRASTDLNINFPGLSPPGGHTATGVLTEDAWQEVGATYDGSAVRLFVDNVEELKESLTGKIKTNTDVLRIGNARYLSPREFKGPIDNLRILRKTSSITENRILMYRRF